MFRGGKTVFDCNEVIRAVKYVLWHVKLQYLVFQTSIICFSELYERLSRSVTSIHFKCVGLLILALISVQKQYRMEIKNLLLVFDTDRMLHSLPNTTAPNYMFCSASVWLGSFL